MRTRLFLPGAWCILLLLGTVHAQGDLRYFYERTTYLDHLNNPGDWWANPAQCAAVTTRQLTIGNVSPVGGRFTLAGARFIAPINSMFSTGVGLSGTASFQNGSLQISTQSAQYESNFSFFTPALQAGIAAKNNLGALGALLIVTSDHTNDPENPSLTPSLGFSIGYLTPRFAKVLLFSASTYALYHLSGLPYWDHSLKGGVSIQTPDSVLGCTLEGALPVSERDWLNYYVVNCLITMRVYSLYAAMIGISTDQTNLFYSNDISIHGGVKAYPSTETPYFGSYEIAVNHNLRILHRFSVGYNFGLPAPKKTN